MRAHLEYKQTTFLLCVSQDFYFIFTFVGFVRLCEPVYVLISDIYLNICFNMQVTLFLMWFLGM